jgi:hypothetical protein
MVTCRYGLVVLALFARVWGEVLFHEDFSRPLTENWTLYGSPQPFLCDTMGLPPPSFDNNGDTLYDSGALSRDSFELVPGLVLECDMYVTSNERGAWILGTLGFNWTPDTRGIDGAVYRDLGLGYCYSGEADWQRPHLQGTLSAALRNPHGENDSWELYRENSYLDSWHRFKLVIEDDLTVSFHVDSTLYYTTGISLPPDIGHAVIILGSRSNVWGRVYIDNVTVRTR